MIGIGVLARGVEHGGVEFFRFHGAGVGGRPDSNRNLGACGFFRGSLLGRIAGVLHGHRNQDGELGLQTQALIQRDLCVSLVAGNGVTGGIP